MVFKNQLAACALLALAYGHGATNGFFKEEKGQEWALGLAHMPLFRRQMP